MAVGLQDRFRTSLKHFRFEKKLSQEQLGELAGVTDKYISDLERGKFRPSLDMIEILSVVLDKDPLELLTDKYYKEFANKNIKIDNIRGRRKRNI